VTPAEVIAEVHRLGGELVVIEGGLKVRPAGILTPELKRAAQEHASEIKALLAECDPASEVLAILGRLKGYTLPASRMPQVGELVARLSHALVKWDDGEPVDEVDDPHQICAALKSFEREVIAIGGEFNCELAEAVILIENAFPGGRLVGVAPRMPSATLKGYRGIEG